MLRGVASQVLGGNPGTFTTLTATGAVSLSPANANVVISPTGTGVVTIAPATAGTLNNVAIGGSTPLAGAFTTLSASSFISAGAQIYSTGANTAHGASRILMDQESAGLSVLTAYGADAATNGTFQLRLRRSDGSNSILAIGLDAAGALTLAAGAVTTGAADSGGAGFKVLRVPN